MLAAYVAVNQHANVVFFSEQSEVAVDGLAQALDSRLLNTGTVSKHAV